MTNCWTNSRGSLMKRPSWPRSTATGTHLTTATATSSSTVSPPTREYVVKARLDPGTGFSFVGHEQLRGYFDSHTHAPDAFHKHVTVNPLVDVDNGNADVQSYFLRVDSLERGPAVLLAAGKYVDRFERGEDGGWRIRSRVCEVENL